MNFFSKLLFGAALATATTATAQQEFLNLDDNAVVTIERQIDASGNSTFSISSNNPALLEDNDNLSCEPLLFEHPRHDYQCRWNMTLKTDYPGVPFAQYPDLNSVSSRYAYVDGINPLPYIDFGPGGLWEGVDMHLAEVLTYADTDANGFNYMPSAESNINIAMTTPPGATGTDRQIIVTMAMDKALGTSLTQYQKVQLIASGIPADLDLYKDGELLGEGYFEAGGNKGNNYADNNNGSVLAWITSYWNVSGGHYADLKIYTNGTSQYDQGLDLSDYNSLELTFQCTNTMTVELFLGTGDDSSQNFLGDVNCGTMTESFTFDISNFNNLHDIQTALWFHIPVWKNTGLNEFSLFMNIHEAILKR